MAYPGLTHVAVGIVVALCCSAYACAEGRPAISATMAAAEDSVTFAMLEARVDVTDEWLLSVAGAYLDPGSARDEAQLRLSAIGTQRFGDWSFENRHLFSFSSASVERYRVRLRAARSRLFGKPELSARAFDEVFFDFDGRRLFRNNFAAGFGIQLTESMSGELYHVWEMNRSRGDNAYLLALLTFRFGVSGSE
jgi:hypothetical protein